MSHFSACWWTCPCLVSNHQCRFSKGRPMLFLVSVRLSMTLGILDDSDQEQETFPQGNVVGVFRSARAAEAAERLRKALGLGEPRYLAKPSALDAPLVLAVFNHRH